MHQLNFISNMSCKIFYITCLSLLFVSIAKCQDSGNVCGFNATATMIPQTITSPGWPDNYPGNSRCDWFIEAESSQSTIQIDFEKFLSEFCCDYFLIYENGSQVKRIRGTATGDQFFSTTNQVHLRFQSDRGVNHPGFMAKFKIYSPESSMISEAATTMVTRISSSSENMTTTSSERPRDISPRIIQMEMTTTSSGISWTITSKSLSFVFSFVAVFMVLLF